MSTGNAPDSTESLNLLIRRTAILRAINRLGCEDWQNRSREELLIRCAEILFLHGDYSAIWVGIFSTSESGILKGFMITPPPAGTLEKSHVRTEVPVNEWQVAQAKSVIRGNSPLLSYQPLSEHHNLPADIIDHVQCCILLPFVHGQRTYGALTIFSNKRDGFPEHEIEFLESTLADFSLVIFTNDISLQLKFERDFNSDIIDTIQALMISITPCGKITRFNPEAQTVTGYSEQEVIDKYWVDIILPPDNRQYYQNKVSELLGKNVRNASFQAPLHTKEGETRTVDWHTSIKPDIKDSMVGMVLFGIDITDQIAADAAFTSAVEKWESIFATIQDPALIATRSGIILDANHATFTASRKSRGQVIGQSVCTILHGRSAKKHDCPLLALLKTGKSRIIHTDLRGLNGDFLLTISPLTSSISSEKAVLLLARDMTEEERLHAEAIRASQLASLGELAAGVAHEINNPINGILNYAQMLEDLDLKQTGKDITQRIIAESRRIEGIVKNLLDFSRYRVQEPEPLRAETLILDCLELVKHQLQKEHILIQTSFSEQLPPVFCNAPQIKQVILNIISNSRYALNRKFSLPHKNKLLIFKTAAVYRGIKPFIRITITDYGVGIEQHILERVYDPFFTTKPNGEGTGLGLSISYGLMRDNGGSIRIMSEKDHYTTTILDLPAVEGG